MLCFTCELKLSTSNYWGTSRRSLGELLIATLPYRPSLQVYHHSVLVSQSRRVFQLMFLLSVAVVLRPYLLVLLLMVVLHKSSLLGLVKLKQIPPGTFLIHKQLQIQIVMTFQWEVYEM